MAMRTPFQPHLAVTMQGGAAKPFSPADIAGLQLWLKADGTLWQDSARTTAATADADPVGCWDDASGNSSNATQTTDSARLTRKDNIQNTLPALLFDGSDDQLSVPGAVKTAAFTHLAVINLTDVTSHRGILGWGYAGLNWRINQTTGKQCLTKGAMVDMGYSNSAVPTGAATVLAVAYDGTTAQFFLNGAADGAPSNAQVPGGTPTGYFGTEDGTHWPFKGYIFEFTSYNAALNATQIANLFTYLNTRWAVY